MTTKATTNGHQSAAERESRIEKLETDVAKLQTDVAALTVQLADLGQGVVKLAHALAAVLAQQLQPAVHKAVLEQLMGVTVPTSVADTPPG